MTKRTFEFNFPSEWYTVEGAKSMDIATLRKEYTRMRDVAQKRLKRLEKDFSESKAYLSHKAGFEKLKDIDARDLPKAFSELAKFVGARSSSASGQREIRRKTIETWNEQGLNLTQKNYSRVIKILEEMRKRKLTYGSDKVVEVADSMLSLDDQHTNQWLDNLEELLRHSDEVKDVVQDYSLKGIPVDMDIIRREVGW